MRWAEPERLALLWLAPALLLLAVWAVRQRGRLESTLGEPAALRKLTGEAGGVARAARLLRRPGQRPRAIVLVSDGENLSGDPDAGVGAARQAGARLFAIGVGTPDGAPILVVDSTGVIVGQRKGPDGHVVISRLDENLLRRLARNGGGRYERGDGSARAALRLADAIRSSGGEEVRGRSIRAYDERFPWFAAAAGLLLLAERAVPRRRKR